MPNLDDLDRFKSIVNSLGNEPAILQERGETLEDVPRPEAGLSDDLNQLLGDTGDLESDGVSEIDSLLQDFDEETEPGGEPEAEFTGEEEPFDAPDIDFDEPPPADNLDISDIEEEFDAGLGSPEEPPVSEPDDTVDEEPVDFEEPGPEEVTDTDDLDLDALIAETQPSFDEQESPAAETSPSGEDMDDTSFSIGDEDIELDIDSDILDLETSADEDASSVSDAGSEELPEFDDEFGDIAEADTISEEEPAGFEEPSMEEFDGSAGEPDELENLDLDQFDFDEIPEEGPESDETSSEEDQFDFPAEEGASAETEEEFELPGEADEGEQPEEAGDLGDLDVPGDEFGDVDAGFEDLGDEFGDLGDGFGDLDDESGGTPGEESTEEAEPFGDEFSVGEEPSPDDEGPFEEGVSAETEDEFELPGEAGEGELPEEAGDLGDLDVPGDEFGDLGDEFEDLGEEFGDLDDEFGDLGDEFGGTPGEESPEEAEPFGDEFSFGEEPSPDDEGLFEEGASAETEDEFELPGEAGEEELPEEAGDLGDLDDEFGDLGDEFEDLDDEFGTTPEEEPAEEAEFSGDETPDEFGINLDLEEGGEDAGPDSFDDIGAPEVDFDSVPSADGFELDEETDDDIDDFEVDQFELGDISEEFGFDEGMDFQTPEAVSADEDVSEFESVEDRIEISDDDFNAIRRTLGTLPLNLKMVIEELIAEKDLAGAELKKILELLSSGASAKAVAQAAEKITGKKIQIPERYEKGTGAEFEAELESFSYIFKTRVLPYLKIGLALLVVLGFLGYMGFRFIYKPLRATSIYNDGYESILETEYIEAREQFDAAYDIWPRKPWFYKYADRFIEEKQYYMAAEMYDSLLSYYPDDVEGLLDYARLESEILAEYPGAEGHLKQVLEDDMYNYDALLIQGDNYLRWAEEDESKYESARRSYAMLIQRYGATDEILFRMMRYFIRTDNFREVIRLKDQFQANPRAQINPEIYAELGGYLITNGVFDEVDDILFRALEVDRSVPEIHYHLSRYYEGLEDYGEMDKALGNALRNLQGTTPLTARRLAMLIDIHNRIGRSHYRKEEYIQAEQSYQEGIRLYEDAAERRLLGPSPSFGELYSNLGDVYYYVSGDFDTAYDLYMKAESNLYSKPVLSYKKGYILYREEKYRDSLMEFYEAAGDFSTDKNLMYATANNLYMLGEYFSAQGYYNHLLDRLEQEFSTIPFLMIDEREDHRGLVEYFEKVYNNLGVTLKQLDNKSADPEKFSRSLAYLARSTEYWDMLTRNPESLERSQGQSRAYLNSRSILYPEGGQVLQIYPNIPIDFEDLRF